MINRLKNGYTVVMNEVLNNPNMSLKAKGLYAFLCSKPDGWNFSYDGLTHQLKEGEKSIRSGIKELVDNGLLLRIPKKNKEGEFKGWDWILHPTEEDLKKYTDPTKHRNNGSCQNGNYHDGNDRDGNYQNGNHLSNNIKEINKSNTIKEYNNNINNNIESVEKEKWTKSKNDLKIFHTLLENEKYKNLKQMLNVDDSFIKQIITYRREIKKPFKTINGPLRVLKDILDCCTTHRIHPYNVLGMMIEREWQSIRPDYSVFNKTVKSNSPSNAIRQGEEILRKWEENKKRINNE